VEGSISITAGRDGPATTGARAELGSAPLTAAIARGDPAAFGRFYELWFDPALALARSISGRDESFCLDVVQDCMLRVVRSMKPLATEGAVQGWMARALFTTTVDRLRRDARRARREQRAAEPGPSEPADPIEAAERIEWLRAQLAALPEGDRRLIVERFEGDKTLAAVGEALGMTGHAVHGRIRRILGRLRAAARELFHE
jgi:RNA polymerase sigma factor (sigma-70 family)